jgi:pimeloyl-ACP methyl ester carboxylesterase
LWLPTEDAPSPYRAIVGCSGYQGLKTIHPARFARSLTPLGYACLAFDYRGFGASEGERGRLDPGAQTEDVLAAVSYLCTRHDVDASRIGLIGWGLGGGIAVAAAARELRVSAVAAVNSVSDGARTTRRLHSDQSWSELLDDMAQDRLGRALSGRSRLVAPFKVLPMDETTTGYVEEELYKAPGFGSQVSLEAVEHLLEFRAEDVVARISPRPLLLVHSAENLLYLPRESELLFEAAGQDKELVLLEGVGHTEWMFDDHPVYRLLESLLAGFFDRAFASPARV